MGARGGGDFVERRRGPPPARGIRWRARGRRVGARGIWWEGRDWQVGVYRSLRFRGRGLGWRRGVCWWVRISWRRVEVEARMKPSLGRRSRVETLSMW